MADASSQLRVSDRDREEVARQIREHYALEQRERHAERESREAERRRRVAERRAHRHH